MTYQLPKIAARAAVLSLMFAGSALAEDDPDWEPLLECRFEATCDKLDRACAPEDTWYTVEYDAQNEAYSLYDTMNKDSRDVTLSRHARLLVFDGVIETEEPRASSSLYRLIVAENGDASFQYGFYIAFDEEDDWRFFSGASTGTCTEADE
ncbi:hypothetical protein LA6_002411 [Marinibacterium anthonyi]|nr:hypothetical protein LA6_002411 [Marinibacterium anthonyi]